MADPGEVNWDGRNDVRDPWSGPASGNEQVKVQQAMYTQQMDRRSIQREVRPPLPQIKLNPPRHGYDTHALGIKDILDVSRDYEPRVDWSGGIGAYTGASRNAQGAI